jgi:MYXO-CTERM domain-containing protein
VSVEYATVGWSATADQDFVPVKGQLSWADGDDADKVIRVPILKDSGPLEQPETLAVELSAPDGGMGLATRWAVVEIRGDAYPAGVFTLEVPSQAWERDLTVNVIVKRQDYGTGAVTVDLTVGGTATNGQDYSLPQQTYRFSWADGDRNPKNLSIPLINDRRKEGEETITVTLSGATGGALIAEPSSATVKILDDDASSSDTAGGGGHSGGLFALLSGLAGLLRLRRRASR